MKVKELFIYNETYPLPPEKYTDFKTRLDMCTNNPMCVNRVKADAESYIADFGKKNGSKLENGEESGFSLLKEETSSEAVTKVSDKPKVNTFLVVALIILGALAIMSKNMTLGVLTIGLAMVLLLV
jgi:hypothetical protein